MNGSGERPAPMWGRLRSIFDGFPPDTPASLDAIELAMHLDMERRALAALDRALARLAVALTSGEGQSKASRLPAPDSAET